MDLARTMLVKNTKIKTLKRKVWNIFSLYVRLRDCDDDGYAKCITCEAVKFWKSDGLQAGHFISREFSSTFLEETNVHAQCASCNMRSGMPDEYAKFIDDTYGEDERERLRLLKYNHIKRSHNDWRSLYENYKNKAEEMALSKGLKL